MYCQLSLCETEFYQTIRQFDKNETLQKRLFMARA